LKCNGRPGARTYPHLCKNLILDNGWGRLPNGGQSF
jgi:hypothetical protein